MMIMFTQHWVVKEVDTSILGRFRRPRSIIFKKTITILTKPHRNLFADLELIIKPFITVVVELPRDTWF